MLYEHETPAALRDELDRLLAETHTVAERNASVARDRAIRLNGIRKASDDYDYERARHLVHQLERGRKKVLEEPLAGTADEYVLGVLGALRDPMEGLALPYAVLEEIQFAYTKGTQDLRQNLYARYHESAERIRNPPKKPLPEGFLELFDQGFEAFLHKKAETEKDWQNPVRRTEALVLAARVKALAEQLGNFTDVLGWIDRERTAAGSRCSSLIRDRDPDGRYDPDLEAEYDRASRRSGTVALLISFLNGYHQG